jgi:hypothetical protein
VKPVLKGQWDSKDRWVTREKLALPVLSARLAQWDHKALPGRKVSPVRRAPSALRGLQEQQGRRAR